MDSIRSPRRPGPRLKMISEVCPPESMTAPSGEQRNPVPKGPEVTSPLLNMFWRRAEGMWSACSSHPLFNVSTPPESC
jgi:hypothetical protein